MNVIDRKTARHYPWGDGCGGWHLLEGGELSVIEERMPPGRVEQRHHHQRSRQFFYVLQGEAMLELEGVMHRMTAGQGLHVAPGEVHQMGNASGTDVRFLVVSSPPSHGDRVLVPREVRGSDDGH
jgi:quercetin dioxygenase-like cupin family protein